MFNIWFDYDMIVCFIHPFWYSCLNTKTYSCFPFCSWCCYLLALVLTFLCLSLFSGGFSQTLPDLHGGLLHLSGITHGGDSHPRILSVRKSRLLVFTERIDEALHNEGFSLSLGTVQKWYCLDKNGTSNKTSMHKIFWHCLFTWCFKIYIFFSLIHRVLA